MRLAIGGTYRGEQAQLEKLNPGAGNHDLENHGQR